ncbi:MAG: hypothetical protein MJY98_08565 [Fibrobacter sp.]|nr:hypothetical protein [Fibrobacter sp.]
MAYAKTSKLYNDVYLKNTNANLLTLKYRCDEPHVTTNNIFRRLDAAYNKACSEGLLNKKCATTFFPTGFYDKDTHEMIFCCLAPHRPPVGKPNQTAIFSGWYCIGEGPLQTVHRVNGVNKKRSIWEAVKHVLGIAA